MRGKPDYETPYPRRVTSPGRIFSVILRIQPYPLEPVGLEQPQPDSLIVGYDGTACHSRSSGTSPTTAIVAAWIISPTPGPDERHADDDLAVLVDDHAGRGRRSRRRTGWRPPRRRSRSRRRGRAARPLAPAPAVSPTAATSGIGEDHLRARSGRAGRESRAPRGSRPAARAAIASPQIRAWYLPMWVSSARWLTSPGGVQPAAVDGRDPQRVVDVEPATRASRPTVSRPMSSVRGARPVATRISSASTRRPVVQRRA